MKELLQNLAVDTIKDTFFTGGNICTDSTGSYIFCICNTSVNIIDIKTGKTFQQILCDEDEIQSIALSPNDQYLVTSHRNLLLKQWNWKENVCVRTWKTSHIAPIQCMNFDVTSTLLATGSSDFTCKIWDLNAQYCTHNFKGAQGIIRVIKFHPNILNELKIYIGSEDSKIRVYDLKTSDLVALLEGHYSSITCFEFIDNNNRLISGSRDNVVIIWDLKTFKSIKTIPIYESIESIIVLPQINDQLYFQNIPYDPSTCFLTCGNDGVIKIWNWQSAKLIYKQNESDSLKITSSRDLEDAKLQPCILQAYYHPQINSIILITIDKLIVFVQLNHENVFQIDKQFIGHHGEILDITVCNNKGNLIALATNSELIKVYNQINWNCQLLKAHTDLVICLSSFYKNDDESYLASSSKDKTIKLWKLDSKTSLFYYMLTAQGHTQDVGSISFSKIDLKFFVSASIDTTIKLWNINKIENTVEVFFTQKAHDKDINSVCVSPNNKYIASGSGDKTAKLWDVTNGKCLAVFKGHKRGVWCVQFSPIEQVIVTSSADSTIKLWSINDFNCVRTFEGHATSVLKVLFITNGTQLISSSSDGLIKIWNIKTNECMSTYDEHEDKVWALCTDFNETKYITGGGDSKLIIWKNITGEMHEEEMEKREEILLQEQEMENHLKNKKYKKALKLAIILGRPLKCYEIITEILTGKNDELSAKDDLKDIIVKLKVDHLQTLVNYAIEWNTNSKYCYQAQILIQVILNNYSPDELIKLNNFSTLVEKFLPYTERHFSRINKLMQQIMFVDFTWSNMKLDDVKVINGVNGVANNNHNNDMDVENEK